MVLHFASSLSILFVLLQLINANGRNSDDSINSKRTRRQYPDYGMKPPANKNLGWDNSHPRASSQAPRHNAFTLQKNWPDPDEELGQLSAVSIDTDGNIIVFHRGDRVWGSQTFGYDNVYKERDRGPIIQNTIITFNATSGVVIEGWGNNMFYLPHGLTVDGENNIWVTDVALHQVFKFPAKRGSTISPVLSLGTPMIPGNDDNHFCKPTDVAILSNGDFFVSDGYCNSRIVKYNKKGFKLMQWGRSTLNAFLGLKPPPNHFSVPHALAVAEDKGFLFVADRENGRVQCFNTTTGMFIYQLHSSYMGSRVFSVAYAPVKGGLLYIVNGPAPQSVQVGGFVVSLVSKQLVAQFNADKSGFQNPHDVAVTADGHQVYVVELNPFKIWKFIQGNISLPSVPTPMNQTVRNGSSRVQVSNRTRLNTLAIRKTSPPDVPEGSTGSVATAVGVIITGVVIVAIVLIVAVIRVRRGCLQGPRWKFRVAPTERFKLGHFLDRHQGFEKVSTEESDDEANGSNAEETTPCAQFA